MFRTLFENSFDHFDHIRPYWPNLEHSVYLDLSIGTGLFGPVYLDLSIWTCLLGPVSLDPSNWLHLFGPVYLDTSILTRQLDPSIGTNIFGLYLVHLEFFYLDLFIWIRLFRPIYLDFLAWTCLFKPKYLNSSI